MGQNSLGGAFDNQPDEKGALAAKNRELQKKYRILTICIVAILLVALALFFLSQCGHGSLDASDTNQKKSESTVQLEWSDWMDSLPAFATGENYWIEEQALYRSRSLETTTSTEQSSMAGWELYGKAEDAGDFGSWTDWSPTEAVASDTREVETQTQYRYRDKETATGASASMPGWELYDTTYTWSNYGSWSGWISSALSESDSREVETKTQYSYRIRNYTTSPSSSLSGWSRYDTSTSYGSWSSWSDTPVSNTSTREVDTRQVQTGTRYYIAHYCTGNTGDSDKYMSGNWKYSNKCDYHELGWFDSLSAFEVDGKQVTYYPNGSKYRCANTCYYFYIMDTENTYKTQYRYRSVSTTYYYYQWSDWSNYTDAYVSGNSDREVSTRTLYRCRDRQSIPTYHFWRWGTWSDWSTNAVSATDSKQVETKLYYHYRDRVPVTTYYFKRWGDWSDYTTTYVAENDTVDVETKMQYRYKSK